MLNNINEWFRFLFLILFSKFDLSSHKVFEKKSHKIMDDIVSFDLKFYLVLHLFLYIEWFYCDIYNSFLLLLIAGEEQRFENQS